MNVNDGKWHHISGVYDGSKMYLYVDGALDNDGSATGTIGTNNQPVYIGENSEMPGREWNGLMDDVRIYNSALDPNEIKALASMGRNDDAAAWGTDDSGVEGWTPLEDQTGRTEDMSFMLFTDCPCMAGQRISAIMVASSLTLWKYGL